MKKFMSLILCFAMVLTLAACGGTTEKADGSIPVTDGQTIGKGSGSSKKRAEQAAAQAAIENWK